MGLFTQFSDFPYLNISSECYIKTCPVSRIGSELLILRTNLKPSNQSLEINHKPFFALVRLDISI